MNMRLVTKPLASGFPPFMLSSLPWAVLLFLHSFVSFVYKAWDFQHSESSGVLRLFLAFNQLSHFYL